MRNLRKRGAVWYYDHGGKPRRWERLGTDEAVALARYEAIRAGAAVPRGTVDAMLGDYLARPRAPLAPGTLVNYRNFRGHLSAVFGYLDPATLTQGDIVRYLRTCPRKSARGEIGLLSLAYVAWIEEGRLTFNPCFGVRIKLPTSRRDRLLTADELERVIAAAPERIAVAIELAYALGLRIGDLCALRWSDFADGVQTAKTGARLRYERTPELDALLARAKALQARVGSLYVLCARAGRQWKPDGLRRHWWAACRAAGVTNAHFHDLRAAGATALDAEHGRIAAQRFLGHKSPQTTERYLRDKRAAAVTPLVRKKA